MLGVRDVPAVGKLDAGAGVGLPEAALLGTPVVGDMVGSEAVGVRLGVLEAWCPLSLSIGTDVG